MTQAFPTNDPPLQYFNIYLSPGYSYACQMRWERQWTVPAARGNARQESPQTEPPVEMVLDAVHQAAQLELQTVRITGVSGTSDPLLYPSIETLLDRLRNYRTSIQIETSGLECSPVLASAISRLPDCTVRIALAGASPSVHDTLLSAPGSFAAATQAARMLADHGVTVELLFPVVHRNAGQVQAAVRLAEQTGAQSLLFIAVSPLILGTPPGSNQNLRDEKIKPLTVEELIALGRIVERQLQPQTRVNLFFDQPPAFRGLHPSARLDGQRSCAITNSLSLLPTGEYAICGMALHDDETTGMRLSGDQILGLAGRDGLREIWSNHPVLVALRAGKPVRLAGVCERCAVQSACLGRCPIESQACTGSFWGPYWFCEAAERAGLFPAGRLIENRW